MTHVDIVGAASPDGRRAFNERLAQNRARVVYDYLRSRTSLADSLYHVTSVGEDWASFRRYLPEALNAGDALRVSSEVERYGESDACERRLRALDGGRIWRLMAARLFPRIRRTELTVGLATSPDMHLILSDEEPQQPEAEPDTVVVAEVETETVAAVELQPAAGAPLHWYIKTNVPAWAMLWTNIAVEFDCAPHWSVQLPVYYSGFNYFTSKRKYRTITLQPEARYWLRSSNTGFFVGAHFGTRWYNTAFGGAVRYQDHDGRTPALGGGIAAGWRMALGKARRWLVEGSVGAGIYRLDYDTFDNRPDGPLTGRRRRTFYGIDQVSVSVGYSFYLKKGGAR